MEFSIRDLSAPDGFWALAVQHPDFDEHTEVLLAATDGGDRWLSVGKAPTGRARSLDFEDDMVEGYYPKLCAFLGFPLEELDSQFRRLCEWQQMCLRSMGPNMWRSIEQGTVEEIAEWRREIESLDTGVLLTAGLTLSDPRAVSN